MSALRELQGTKPGCAGELPLMGGAQRQVECHRGHEAWSAVSMAGGCGKVATGLGPGRQGH